MKVRCKMNNRVYSACVVLCGVQVSSIPEIAWEDVNIKDVDVYSNEQFKEFFEIIG